MTTTTTQGDATLREAARRTLDTVTAWMATGGSVLQRPRDVDAALMALGNALEAASAPVEGDATDRLPEVAEARRALTCLYLATPEEVAADVSRKVEAAFSALRSSPSQLRPLQCVCDLPSEAAGPCPVHQPAAFSAPQPQPDGEVRRALEVLATNLENPAADRAWCARTLRSLLSAAPAPSPAPTSPSDSEKE